MPYKPPGLLVALVAALALVLAPSTMSATAAEGDAFSVAADYASDNAASFGVSSADVADLFATSVYRTKHLGVTHVNLNQRYQGLEVFGGHATVTVADDGSIVFASGSFVKGLDSASGAGGLNALEAVRAAAAGLGLDAPSDLRVLEGAPASAEVVVSRGGISDSAITAKLGYLPTKSGLRLAWQVVIDDSTDIHLWNASVDATTGELIRADDWTIEDDVEELGSTLTGGSLPTPPAVVPDALGVTLNPVNDGSSYRVFDLALESPNDGPRRLVNNPADALASPFGWHDTDGVAGAEFTITRGNNNHAYFDQDSNNAADVGTDADGGAGLDFDFPVDFNEHSQNYRDAVLTNLFFGCNAFHDVLYLYGWDEVAGNYQANNYGRGGTGNDYVRCEAADGGGTNNANFSPPAADGNNTPRMQMFLWPGNQFGSQNQVSVPGVGDFGAGWARFGPPAPSAGITGQLVDAGNGCVAADYASAPAGDWIAITTAGNTGCQNIDKARTAAAAGAKAIAMSSGTSTTAILTGSQTTLAPTIPALAITTADGNTIRAAIAAGPTSGTVRKHPSHPGIRDGDFENGIIWHEYGHGLSTRLTGGPGINCLGGAEQQGEGWSDYVANVAMIDPDLDDPQQPRGMGPYALFQNDRHGAGIRPRPYTRDMTVQPATYDSIKTNAWLTGSLATPHGVGHAWAAIMWDMTWDLIDKHGFSGNIYLPWDAGGNNRAMQYMVDGLKLQGCNPTFVRSRDAILASANTLGGGAAGDVAGDSCSIWASFSRRGVGFGAVGGGTGRDDNTEAFDTHPSCREGFAGGAPAAYGSLNDADPGKVVRLRFDAGGATTLDAFMPTNSPFSRRVDCSTLQVPSSGTRITPREYPIDAATAAGEEFKYKQNEGLFLFPWQTEESWLGTCREFVVTRTDGKQHRAFFRFNYPFEGFLATAENPPVVNAANARNGVTLWWKLGGDRGLDIFAAGTVPSSREIDCATQAPVGPFEPAATPSWDTFGYQSFTGRYYFPWHTKSYAAGTCREFSITLKDGTTHSAWFNFVK